MISCYLPSTTTQMMKTCLTTLSPPTTSNVPSIVKTGTLTMQCIIGSVRSSNSYPDLLVTQHHHHHPLFQITPVLNTGLSLSEPLQLYKGYNAVSTTLAKLGKTLAYSGTLWHTLAKSVILWHTLAYSGIL